MRRKRTLPPATTARAISLAELEGAGCYLLHFDTPYRHARHYLGWAQCIGRRLNEHAQGRGANLTRVVLGAGISWQIAAIWPGACRADERRLHKRHDTPKFCPLCRALRGARKA